MHKQTLVALPASLCSAQEGTSLKRQAVYGQTSVKCLLMLCSTQASCTTAGCSCGGDGSLLVSHLPSTALGYHYSTALFMHYIQVLHCLHVQVYCGRTTASTPLVLAAAAVAGICPGTCCDCVSTWLWHHVDCSLHQCHARVPHSRSGHADARDHDRGRHESGGKLLKGTVPLPGQMRSVVVQL